MRIASDEGKPLRPSDFYHDWLNNLVAGTKNVLESADRLQLTERQGKSLEAEIALYSNVIELVDSGVAPQVSAPTPVNSQIIEQLRAGLDHWTNRITTEVGDLPIPEEERLELTETVKTADVIRAYLASYPVVGC